MGIFTNPKVGSSCSARPQLWCRTSPEPMTSSINYTAFSDDTHYVFSIVCCFDTKKAKVKFDKEKNAIHVMGPAPGKGMEKVNGYVLLPKNAAHWQSQKWPPPTVFRAHRTSLVCTAQSCSLPVATRLRLRPASGVCEWLCGV